MIELVQAEVTSKKQTPTRIISVSQIGSKSEVFDDFLMDDDSGIIIDDVHGKICLSVIYGITTNRDYI